MCIRHILLRLHNEDNMEKRLTEIFYQESIKRLPKCVYCHKYATRVCSFWEASRSVYMGHMSAHYQLCDSCPAPKVKPEYNDYRIFPEKQWAELRQAVLEYEQYSKLDRVNRFI